MKTEGLRSNAVALPPPPRRYYNAAAKRFQPKNGENREKEENKEKNEKRPANAQKATVRRVSLRARRLSDKLIATRRRLKRFAPRRRDVSDKEREAKRRRVD